jgi:cytidylate kinase
VKKKVIIAIDGPAGAGKSTIARSLARRLGFIYIDTGAMYRAVALLALRAEIDLNDAFRMVPVARHVQIEFGREGAVLVNGEDVTGAIREPDVSSAASRVAAIPGVREAMRDEQRRIGGKSSVVMEGRDIGTVVFPNADLKIYLDASAEERARRRLNDPAHSGGQTGAAAVAASIQARDQSDTTRSASPLTVASDAVLIDTTGVPIPDVVTRVMRLVDQKLGR